MNKRAVVYLVSGKHVTLTATSLYSLIDSYDSTDSLEVLVVHADIYPDDLKILQDLPEMMGKPQIIVNLLDPPAKVDEIDYDNDRYPKMVLWRLFLADSLVDYDQLIYLDNDTLVYRSIDQMFNLVPDDKAFGAVPDYYIHLQALVPSSHTYQEERSLNYINAGVLVINVHTFNQLIPAESILQFTIDNPDFQFADQGILNAIGEGYIELLPLRFNDQKSEHWLESYAKPLSEEFSQEIIDEREQLVVRHFIQYVSNDMPWEHLRTDDRFEDDFWATLMAMKQKAIEWSRKQDHR
ncbi:glycosyltransferase [Lacticaseibacillus brantae]|nr:glycosyltransferase [Lacticaseibacillus brantae]